MKIEYLKPRVKTPSLLFRETPALKIATSGTGTKNGNATLILVHVAGKVRRAGLQKLPNGARVYQAIAAAGGATDTKAASLLNLAAPLRDGEKIVVGVSEDTTSEISVEKHLSSSSISVKQNDTKPSTDSSPSNATKTKILPSRPVNLNTASAVELQQLPGIGPAMASRILAARQQKRFGGIADLDAIKGIGPKKLEKMRPYVTF